MNTKIVEQAIDETLHELLDMSVEDFQQLLKKKPGNFKKILLDGQFIIRDKR